MAYHSLLLADGDWNFVIAVINKPQRTAEGSVSSSDNALDRNPPTMSEVCDTPITNNNSGTNGPTQ